MSIALKLRSGGVAALAIRRPVGTLMIALALVVLGALSLMRLGIDLLPNIIYPEISVRVADPGVPARIMEDQVTRFLEEQLSITEDAISVQSQTTEGQSRVELTFPYGKDIDIALRDASTRLDRARRFLPATIDPPVIFKRDPSQIPVAEFVVSSPLRSPVELRSWVDDLFAVQFVNLPGVAAAEVGGGLSREVVVQPDQQRLAAWGLTVQELADAIRRGNIDVAGGRLVMDARELSGRTVGRLDSVEAIANLPLRRIDDDGRIHLVRLGEVARVFDTHEDERLRIRFNNVPGVMLSIQKQPDANTVAVVDAVRERLDWLQGQRMMPDDITVSTVSDQSVFVRHAVQNAATAAISGAVLAMVVVYLFLGSLRRTLVIGSAIPIAIMVTFVLMEFGGLTLNIMTLGGLALGVGMLIDSAIVMLENIRRHQQMGEEPLEAALNGAREVNSAIVAATSTNLAAILPFLFISGLVGLLFRELIFTISAAMVAAMVVALTVVPTLGARVHAEGGGRLRRAVDGAMDRLRDGYAWLLGGIMRLRWLVVALFVGALLATYAVFTSGQQIFLPTVDDGNIRAIVTLDTGISVDEMDRTVRRLEALIQAQPEVENLFTLSGGFVFGRSQREVSNRATLRIQLVPRAQRDVDIPEWIGRMNRLIAAEQIAGLRVALRAEGIRGIRLGSGDDEISVRIQGSDLDRLQQLGNEAVALMRQVEGLRNIQHTYEESRQELAVTIDRERAAALGLDVEAIGRNLRIALDGSIVSDFLDGDRAYAVRMRLPREEVATAAALEELVIGFADGPVPLRDVAQIELAATPPAIQRDNQQRIVEISASLTGDVALGEVAAGIHRALDALDLPDGYALYDGGAAKALQEGQQMTRILLGLALFLVFTVMAVQYESLRNPLVILFSVPFAAVGVSLGLQAFDIPVSMPVWLGMIMLAGIVVNNAIVLVEYIELRREEGLATIEAILEAARQRLRPILMTTMTTVAGMLPLAIGLGEGAELLQPLAQVIVFGLSFSLLVSLLLVPVTYRIFNPSSN